MKIYKINFTLAKLFYQEFHRTNKPPVGHKVSYVGLLGDDWTFLTYADFLDLPGDWVQDRDWETSFAKVKLIL